MEFLVSCHIEISCAGQAKYDSGGLRYHGMSSVLSQLYEDGYMEARSVEQTAVFEAAEEFARVEGIL